MSEKEPSLPEKISTLPGSGILQETPVDRQGTSAKEHDINPGNGLDESEKIQLTGR